MPNQIPARVARGRTKAAPPVDINQMSLFADDDSFDQPLDPRIVDPGGTPLPPVRRHSTAPEQAVTGGGAQQPAPPPAPALTVVTSTDTPASFDCAECREG